MLNNAKISEVIQCIDNKNYDSFQSRISKFINAVEPIITDKNPKCIAIYGAGSFCKALIHYLKYYNPSLFKKIVCIIDTYVSGIKISGKPVVSLEQAVRDGSFDMIIISVSSKNDEIRSLIEGFDEFKNDIVEFPDLTNEQLFFSISDINTTLNPKGITIDIKRYLFALPYCINKKVLDIACGCGYGSNLLASRASSVIGGDINSKALQYAKDNYLAKNIEFRHINIFEMNGIERFNTIVSFETIEHLPPEKTNLYFKKLKSHLDENGIFIISSPYATKDGQGSNKYHINEMTIDTFTKLLKPYFSDYDIYLQDLENNGSIEYINFTQPNKNANLNRYVYIFVCYNR